MSSSGGQVTSFTSPTSFPDGSAAAPAVTWNNEPTTGLYRAGAGEVRYSILGNDMLRILNGGVSVPDGAVTLTGINFQGQQNTGFYRRASAVIAIVLSGTRYVDIQAGPFVLRSTGSFSWASGDPGATSVDTSLFRDAADTIAQRRGAVAQTKRVYGTFTDASNYERLSTITAAGDYSLLPEAAGTGTLRGLRLGSAAGRLGFFGSAAIAKPAATGSRGGNAALASLLTELANLGLITDSTTA